MGPNYLTIGPQVGPDCLTTARGLDSNPASHWSAPVSQVAALIADPGFAGMTAFA